MMSRLLFLPLVAGLAVAAAPPETDGEGQVLAERRLRACLSANGAGGQTTFDGALQAARAACRPQINALRDVRVIHATAGLEPAAARVVERRVTIALNNEIAHAVADFSGMPVPHAHH